MQNILEEKILKTIKKYKLIKHGDNIVIGVSGGPDSMTLLSVLHSLKQELQLQLFVAHINHMIRPEAEEETIYVEQFCKKLNIPCFIKRIDVQKEAQRLHIGTEAMGREVRYAFYKEVSQQIGANKVATAHNANDNAETVLMNLMRGSGTSGLKGIEPIRDSIYIRPLIECTRKEIEKYCQEQNLNPKYDKSNLENVYTRNKIRNLLIPYIEKEFNPNIIETLNRLSTIVAEEEEFFHKIVENEFEKLHLAGDKTEIASILPEEDRNKPYIILNRKKFQNLDIVIKSRVLLYTIKELLGSTQSIEKKHITDIIKLCNNNVGNKFLTPNKKLKIFIKKGKIFLIDRS